MTYFAELGFNLHLLEKSRDSITLIWRRLDPGQKKFELSMKAPDEAEWKVLSCTLTNTVAKKNNCLPSIPYTFKVRAQALDGNWTSYSDEWQELVLDPELELQMTAPTLRLKDSMSVTIEWQEVQGAEGYRLRFRADDEDWQNIDSIIKGTSVRKKGLSSDKRYYFSVIPEILGGTSKTYISSPGSLPLQIALLSPHISRLLPTCLLSPTGKVITADALAGKVIFIYFSAHWCGPCRNYTPQLAEFYKSAKSNNFEVIFCSADHSESEFSSYYMSHPWKAIPYNNSEREALQSLFKVSGIPRLVVLGPSGKIACDNAVSMSLTSSTIDLWSKI